MDGILIINKTKGYTSHDIVYKIRKIVNEKVGHTGTLDPLATGVLPLLIGKGTLCSKYLINHDKKYQVELKLGKKTTTADSEGELVEEKDVLVEMLQEDKIEQVLETFLGQQEQIPPIYSAIKVNGKKLYEYARNNETVEIPKRVITIDYIELISIVDNLVKFKVGCSKGTYIRSLCFDIAKKLDYPGHMYSLIRSKSGDFSLSDSYSLEEIENGEFEMLSMEEALSNYPKLVVDDENIIYHGKKIKSKINHQVAIYNQNNKVLAIYGPDGNGYLKNIRGLW